MVQNCHILQNPKYKIENNNPLKPIFFQYVKLSMAQDIVAELLIKFHNVNVSYNFSKCMYLNATIFNTLWPKSRKVLMFVFLQKDATQYCDASKLDCVHCACCSEQNKYN